MPELNPYQFQPEGETFGIAPIGVGRMMHLVTGETSTKCNPLADVHEPQKFQHPGGKLTKAVVGEIAGLGAGLCNRCFPER